MVKRTEDVDVMVGSNIKTIRVARGLSQEQLAAAVADLSGAPMHQQTVLKIESGQRPLRFAEARWFAWALEVSINALGHGTETVAVTADLMRRRVRVEGTHQELIDLTRRLADETLDLAVGVSQARRGAPGLCDSEDLSSEIAVAEIQLRADFGADVNEVMLEQLAQSGHVTGPKAIKPEFAGDTYTEVLGKIAGGDDA